MYTECRLQILLKPGVLPPHSLSVLLFFSFQGTGEKSNSQLTTPPSGLQRLFNFDLWNTFSMRLF